MLSPEDTGYGTTIRASRVASRRELLKNKRMSSTTRTTDMLPTVDEEEASGKLSGSKTGHLREENQHLRQQLAHFQGQLEEYRSGLDLLDAEIETIHHAHQQEIEQYQQQLRDMMEERNQMFDVNQQLERRYQDLYRTFQDSVDEEANKLVQEAAQTLVLSPEHAPALLNDVVKTLEAQAKQTEDQRSLELLSVMRQAQYKSELLEQEVVRERNELAAERERLNLLQANISEIAQQRYQTERARLRARWTLALTLTSIFLFALMVVLELIFYSLNAALSITLFVPLGICMALSYVFAHMYATGRIKVKVQARGASPKAQGKGAKAPKN
jgi:hypothetical protein